MNTNPSDGLSISIASKGFNQAIAGQICERIAIGKSLRTICADTSMPGRTTICRWLADHPDFQRAMSLARGMQADALAEEILEIADNEPDPIRARVMVDARRWYASKLAPKKYGDRIEHEVSGDVDIVVTIGGKVSQ